MMMTSSWYRCCLLYHDHFQIIFRSFPHVDFRIIISTYSDVLLNIQTKNSYGKTLSYALGSARSAVLEIQYSGTLGRRITEFNIS